ncbi:unnamed protein product [Trifolium pratense]|uniref:Uncharacterized protein n=1 Tax=Trifolium pratense TaxID=57577 RepID=A0ACB0LBZ7_TRIPR|nr:unnamed protein product [Trifolium pratense]
MDCWELVVNQFCCLVVGCFNLIKVEDHKDLCISISLFCWLDVLKYCFRPNLVYFSCYIEKILSILYKFS